MAKNRSLAGYVLKPGNYLRITNGWHTVLVPATAKTIDAYNTLFGADALGVDQHWDDDGEYFSERDIDDTVQCNIVPGSKLQRGMRDRVEKVEAVEAQAEEVQS